MCGTVLNAALSVKLLISDIIFANYPGVHAIILNQGRQLREGGLGVYGSPKDL